MVSWRCSLFIVAACGGVALSACDGLPATDNGTGATESAAIPAAATVPAGPKVKTDHDRVIELEAQVADLRRLLRTLTADDAGNLTLAGALRVNGPVGINAATIPGVGLTVAGETVGAKISGPTGIMARGTGAAGVGLDSDGAVNGVLATSKSIGVAAAGNDFSFYGFKGLLRNDGNAVIRGTDPVRAGAPPRAGGRMVSDTLDRRALLAPALEPTIEPAGENGGSTLLEDNRGDVAVIAP